MKALVKSKSEPGLWMQEVPKPTPGDNEVLIKIRKTTICGTDINIYKWGDWAQKNVPIPNIVGHEFIGTIEALGKNVQGLKVGMRVSAESHIICHQCEACRVGNGHLCRETKIIGVHCNGCFAEYAVMPAFNIFVIPESVSDEVAAFFDPYGNAIHTALSFDLVGQNVLITGAGPIGIMAIGICKKAGARSVTITDISPYRLALAQKFAPDAAINIQTDSLSASMQKLGIRDGYDVCLEMSGSDQALNTILQLSKNGADIGLLGILPPNTVVDWNEIIFKCLKIKGICGREIFKTWYKMTRLLEGGLDISPIITHRLPYQEFQKGFDAMLSGQSGKVILEWS